ncbi:hypothetical protein AA0229_1861 [Gluconobacter cerinus NRIC 0229]|uniref:Uncharacterized protein n=1 Tax=Gluconobacter cerinus TaxID=38307 RepID=A0AAV5NAS2_9PROT|nr:hypothetical protein AA0229_1861 [Gluconobacter cerinus NRIC 0229]GLQ61541.1 hypothetical protein GCM10007867_03860 [Gluconobacter cerinus]
MGETGHMLGQSLFPDILLFISELVKAQLISPCKRGGMQFCNVKYEAVYRRIPSFFSRKTGKTYSLILD